MALHPQAKAFLDMLASAGGPPLEQLPVEEARKVAMALIDFGGPEEPVAEVQNRGIPSPTGPIPLRVYRPVKKETLPALVYFHGGGFVICDLDTHDRLCRSLANASGCVVISVDYPLAPEYQYPAAVVDAYAATKYVAEHAGVFGIDPNRIAVGGDSAGGTLATVVSFMARDRGGPRVEVSASDLSACGLLRRESVDAAVFQGPLPDARGHGLVHGELPAESRGRTRALRPPR